MFEKHTNFTRAAYIIIGLNSLIGLLSLAVISSFLSEFKLDFQYITTLFLSILLFLNVYFAFLIYKKKLFMLKFCLWLYGFQIIGLKTDNFEFSLVFGTKLEVTWSIGSFNLMFNIMAFIILFVLFKALSSLKPTQPK